MDVFFLFFFFLGWWGGCDSGSYPKPLKHEAYPAAANEGGKLVVPTT